MSHRVCSTYRRGGDLPEALFTDCEDNLAHRDLAASSVRAPTDRYGDSVLFGAEESFTPFLGENLLVYLVLAMGAALVAGNIAAIVRPPTARDEGELEQAPVTRSLVMAGIGLIAALWALVSLMTS